jgi:hypothetical protein
MSAPSDQIMAFLDCVLTEQERSLTPLVGLGTCPDWGHCQPECTHQFGINESEAKLRRVASERQLLKLHAGRMHSCPATDETGYLDEWTQFDHSQACPVVELLAEGYGWKARQTPLTEGDQVT